MSWFRGFRRCQNSGATRYATVIEAKVSGSDVPRATKVMAQSSALRSIAQPSVAPSSFVALAPELQ